MEWRGARKLSEVDTRAMSRGQNLNPTGISGLQHQVRIQLWSGGERGKIMKLSEVHTRAVSRGQNLNPTGICGLQHQVIIQLWSGGEGGKIRKLSEVNTRAVSKGQNELIGKFKMSAGDVISIRGEVMEYTYIPTGDF